MVLEIKISLVLLLIITNLCLVVNQNASEADKSSSSSISTSSTEGQKGSSSLDADDFNALLIAYFKGGYISKHLKDCYSWKNYKWGKGLIPVDENNALVALEENKEWGGLRTFASLSSQ